MGYYIRTLVELSSVSQKLESIRLATKGGGEPAWESPKLQKLSFGYQSLSCFLFFVPLSSFLGKGVRRLQSSTVAGPRATLSWAGWASFRGLPALRSRDHCLLPLWPSSSSSFPPLSFFLIFLLVFIDFCSFFVVYAWLSTFFFFFRGLSPTR